MARRCGDANILQERFGRPARQFKFLALLLLKIIFRTSTQKGARRGFSTVSSKCLRIPRRASFYALGVVLSAHNF